MNTLTVGVVQQSCSADRQANLAKSEAGVRRAAGRNRFRDRPPNSSAVWPGN
jgi:hypothetical protein